MSSAGAPFDLVLFDLDGTLVDSLPDIAWALNATLSSAHLPTLPLDTVSAFVGDGAATLIDRALAFAAAAGAPSPTASAAALLSDFLATYAGRVCIDSRLYPGIAELLQQLTARGVGMAVVTNKAGDLARGLLGALGVAAAFGAIIGDGDGFPRKPDPTAAHAIMKKFGAAPTRTAVVGDGVPDLRVARAIPCTSIAAGWGYVPSARLAQEQPTHLAASPAAAFRLLSEPE